MEEPRGRSRRGWAAGEGAGRTDGFWQGHPPIAENRVTDSIGWVSASQDSARKKRPPEGMDIRLQVGGKGDGEWGSLARACLDSGAGFNFGSSVWMG